MALGGGMLGMLEVLRQFGVLSSLGVLGVLVDNHAFHGQDIYGDPSTYMKSLRANLYALLFWTSLLQNTSPKNFV